jgi:hypothetical protein
VGAWPPLKISNMYSVCSYLKEISSDYANLYKKCPHSLHLPPLVIFSGSATALWSRSTEREMRKIMTKLQSLARTTPCGKMNTVWGGALSSASRIVGEHYQHHAVFALYPFDVCYGAHIGGTILQPVNSENYRIFYESRYFVLVMK